MSVYRCSSIPAPLRTEATVDDLRHLDVVTGILRLLNEPAASAVELARLVDRMPVLAARLGARFGARVGDRPSTALLELTLLGNRDLEAVLFKLLEELTDLQAEQSGIPAHGSVFPALASVHPGWVDGAPPRDSLGIPRDEPIGGEQPDDPDPLG